jgi:hypothetical protein
MRARNYDSNTKLNHVKKYFMKHFLAHTAPDFVGDVLGPELPGEIRVPTSIEEHLLLLPDLVLIATFLEQVEHH